MKRQCRSALMASIHETAEGLHAAGVMDERTMREFDELCQPTTPYGNLRQISAGFCNPTALKDQLLAELRKAGLQPVLLALHASG